MALPPLLRTKFLIPRRRAETQSVPRAALLARLKQSLDKRLLLLSAPPGYGKTMLLTEFTAAAALPVAWYQLDSSDSDPATFLAAVIECFGNLHGTALAARALLISDTGPVSPERVLTVLINELTEITDQDWVAVLEDYHLITNPAVHALTDYLLENAPPTLHLVISTRSDPPLALARLRARGQLAEFRTADLRFNADEIADWLTRAVPSLSAASIRTLTEKTEGWAAGLQLALASLMGKDPASADHFIANLNGAHRFIFEYLAGEVFRRQPPRLQQFLLCTAILDQLNATACNAILNVSDSQATLEYLEVNNLFTASLDESRSWFRYHLLFRDFLLGKLRHDLPEERLALERTAGNYYEGQLEPEAAFLHYLEGNEVNAAARVLAAFAPDYTERGRVEVLQRYFTALPEATLRANPALLLYHGDVLRRLGRASSAIARYDEARTVYAVQNDSQGLCRTLTELAEIARSQGDYQRAQALAAEAVSQTDAPNRPDPALRARALMALAKSEGFLVGMDRGRTLAEEAVEQSRRAGDALSPRARAALLRSLGQICWWHGDPQATVRYCREALQAVSDDISPLAAEALITMATPYLYRRDLNLALECAERGLDIAQRLQLNELLPIAYATLGNVLTRRGDLAQAEAGLRQAMELSRGLGLETHAQVMAAGYLAYNLCQQGRADEARQIAESAIWPYAGSTDTYEVCVCRSVLADIALDAGQLDEAERLFTGLLEVDSRRQYRIPLAMVYFGLAYIYLKTGRREEGRRMAVESVNLIEPTGALQLYLDQGERGAIVGESLAEAGIKSPFKVHGPEIAERWPALAKTQNDSVRAICLGTFRVFAGDCEVTQEQWVSTKARDLLAYFVTFRRERVSLDRVFDALWPEKNTQSKTAFHTALYRMRQALRTEARVSKFILAEAGEYHLDAAHFHVDIDEFEALIAQARTTRDELEAAGYYDRAISLYNGEYLDNLYYDWLLPERRRLSDTILNALRALAASRATEGNYENAQALLQRAITLDPLLEDLYCNLMRYYAEVGNRSGVARQYQLLSQHLGDELGVPPSATTQDLYAQLMAGLNRMPQSK